MNEQFLCDREQKHFWQHHVNLLSVIYKPSAVVIYSYILDNYSTLLVTIFSSKNVQKYFQ